MGSLSLAEILVILVVILVVFGPRRLPELSRRTSELLSKLREATSYVRHSIDADYGESIEPIRQLKKDFDDLKGDVKGAFTGIADLDGRTKPPPDVDEPAETGETGEPPEPLDQ